MPRLTPSPARLNLRAVLLLLAASALSFLLAWRFSQPDTPEPPRTAAPTLQPTPAPEPAPPASGLSASAQPPASPPASGQAASGQAASGQAASGQAASGQTGAGQPAPGQPTPEQARPGQTGMPGQIPANTTQAALALASGSALAVAPAAPAQANASVPGPTRPEPVKPESPKPSVKPEAKPDPAKPQPKPASAPPAQKAESPKAEPAQVLGIVPAPGKDEFVLTIRTSRKVERYRSMNLDNPKKLAIDLMGKWTHKLKAQDLNAGFVRRLDVGDHPDFLRLVLIFDDRTKTSPIRATFSNGPDGLTVRVPR